MIYYNMRYRGPYEYEKFTLNILNYVNFVNDYIADLENYTYDLDPNDGIAEYITLKDFENQINQAYEKALEHSEIVYKSFIMNK